MLVSGGSDVGVKQTDLSTLSLSLQLNLCNGLNIFGGHGAGLTWVLFMRPESTIIEILPFYRTDNYFRNLARLSGVITSLSMEIMSVAMANQQLYG